jgi:predicted nicotinamide N-methyase
MSGEQISSEPHLLETPEAALGEIQRERVLVEGRTFVIERPEGSDRLFDHPYVNSAFARDEYMPYWADLWPAARMLAKVVAKESWTKGLEALEIGCGLGLPGIAALDAGLKVTFSDWDATALRFAANNAYLNGFDSFKTLQMDWHYPPADLRVPVVLAADLTYEERNVEPIVSLIKRVLLPGGLCLLTDQDRLPEGTIKNALANADLNFSTQIIRAGEPGGRRVKGTLYRVRHKG